MTKLHIIFTDTLECFFIKSQRYFETESWRKSISRFLNTFTSTLGKKVRKKWQLFLIFRRQNWRIDSTISCKHQFAYFLCNYINVKLYNYSLVFGKVLASSNQVVFIFQSLILLTAEIFIWNPLPSIPNVFLQWCINNTRNIGQKGVRLIDLASSDRWNR